MFESLIQLTILLAVCLILVAIGFYVVSKLRPGQKDPDLHPDELLTKFQDLHDRGELSENEYSTIKSMLAEKIVRELNSKTKKE